MTNTTKRNVYQCRALHCLTLFASNKERVCPRCSGSAVHQHPSAIVRFHAEDNYWQVEDGETLYGSSPILETALDNFNAGYLEGEKRKPY